VAVIVASAPFSDERLAATLMMTAAAQHRGTTSSSSCCCWRRCIPRRPVLLPLPPGQPNGAVCAFSQNSRKEDKVGHFQSLAVRVELLPAVRQRRHGFYGFRNRRKKKDRTVGVGEGAFAFEGRGRGGHLTLR
jgi:hypothetical protein